MSRLYFSPYRVSTITSNYDIVLRGGSKCKIDLGLLFNNIAICDKDLNFIWTQCVDKASHEDITRGEYPNKKRRSTYKKSRRKFDNQVSFLFKMSENYYPNVKVFQNGNIQMTGSRCFEDTRPVIEKMISEIQRIAKEGIKIIDANIEDVTYDNFKVRLINTDFRAFKNAEMTDRFFLKRKELHNLLIKNNDVIAWFNANTYPGVKIEYWWDRTNPEGKGKRDMSKPVPLKGEIGDIKKITIAVFESGSILITGAISFEQVNEAYAFICDFMRRHADTIGVCLKVKDDN